MHMESILEYPATIVVLHSGPKGRQEWRVQAFQLSRISHETHSFEILHTLSRIAKPLSRFFF